LDKPNGCGENKAPRTDGSCIFKECRDYTHEIFTPGTNASLVCKAGPCDPKTEILTRKGLCEKCKAHTKPAGTIRERHFTECKAPPCPDGHINGPDGSCRICAAGTIPNTDKSKCMISFCQGNNP